MSSEPPLGKASTYPSQYAPELLFAIPRSDSRDALDLGAELPFTGTDIWNAWELTWLGPEGLPVVATAEIRVPADSPNIAESKSLKLYLNSFAMTPYASTRDVEITIARDLGACFGAEIEIQLLRPSSTEGGSTEMLPGTCIDVSDAKFASWEVDADLLQADGEKIVRESLHSHLLRSLCPVTNQPDTGSVLISYEGPRIDPDALLQYVVSYREHNDFHESCVERMFVDIAARCGAQKLSVTARYQRRGGIDINPFRSNYEDHPPNLRLWRQ